MSDFPLDREEALFGAAFEALPEAVCILEPVGDPGETPREWRYLATNHALCRLLGVDDLTGRMLGERYPDAAAQWAQDFERVIARGTPEVLVRKGTNNPQIYEVVLSPLTYAGRTAIMSRIRDISSEHLAREKRREADARYKLLFDAIDEGFCIIEVLFDDDGTPVDYVFLEANDAFVEHTGLKDPVGKPMRSLQPDIEDKWIATYGRIAMTGVAERFDSESGVMDRWFDVFAFPIGERAPYQLGILFEDIGARKSMEFALRHSENRLQSLIEATSDLIFRINPEGTLMQQVGGKNLLGEVSGESDWIEEFVAPSDRAHIREAVDTAIAAHHPIELEHRYIRPDGSIGWVYSRAVPVFDDQRNVTEWFGMATDITNRRLTERQLAHGAQMLRVASEIGKVGLWDWNVETGEIYWSDEHYRMEGYEPGEIVPTFEIWADRLHPEDRATSEARLALAMENGDDYVNEYRVCHPNGDIVWLSARGRFLYDERGQPVRMLGAMIDTTQRRREEEWQKLLVAELQHRVRNLIGMVRSVARLSAPSHRHVDEYVDHLIGRLQAMGRTQSTLTRSPGRSVDLAELVREELLVHAVQPDQCHVDGPEVALSPHAAEIVTLAIHELATNSIKYGALGDTGYIRIVWALQEKGGKPWVSLRWQETAPVRKTKQTRKGFGRKLIEERVPYELQGEGRFALHDTGVLAEFEFPLSDAGSILDTRS
jgi:PAS domain S-box-containing protein